MLRNTGRVRNPIRFGNLIRRIFVLRNLGFTPFFDPSTEAEGGKAIETPRRLFAQKPTLLPEIEIQGK